MGLAGYFLKVLIITIVIEWAFSWLFLRHRRDRIIVILTQCITNPLINLIVILRPFGLTFWQLIWPLELAVVLTEGAIYKHSFTPKNKIHPYLFSFLANAISFTFGLFLANML